MEEIKKPTIVLVEDDKVLSYTLSGELGDAGFEVAQAYDGKEGLQLAKDKKPDLILLDLLIPVMDGMTVLSELKKSPHTSDIPVIILTIISDDDDIKKGLQLGANDYIVKSQHTVSEIVAKVKDFFTNEQQPKTKKSEIPGKLKIALIEDDKLLSKMLREELGDRGFVVSYAYDGKSGLEMVLDEHPDLILLDIIMPIMDGREMAQKLREDEWGKNVPVIFLTNLDRVDILIKMDPRMASVKDYIVKEDWKLEEVVKKIRDKLNV